MKQVAPLRYDVIFKKAFCVPEIFKAFVHDFIGIDLEITHIETEKSFAPPIGQVKPRFDLFAQDEKNRVIVGIQHERYLDHYDKFLHYHCVALLEQITQSENYRPNLKVFTLVVLTSGDRHQTDVSIIDFDPHDLKGKPLGEISHKVFYICPKYASDETPPAYREWMRAIDDTLDGEVEESQYHRPEVRKIFDYIETSQISPEDWARMKDEYNQEEKLLEEHNKGKEEGIKETVRNLLKKGYLTVEQISDATGLTVDEIKGLEENP